jgi:hypothetical protein
MLERKGYFKGSCVLISGMPGAESLQSQRTLPIRSVRRARDASISPWRSRPNRSFAIACRWP